MKQVLAFNKFTHNLIGEIAKQKGFQVQELSQNFILKIDDNKHNKVIYTYGNLLPLNSASAQRLCVDKSAFSTVMEQNSIPHVKHTLYKNPKYDKLWTIADLKKEFRNYAPLVLKDNFGASGKDVFLIKSERQLLKVARKLLRANKDIAVSPYIEYQNEYRLIMLDKECKLCYKKVIPFVIGNGKDNVEVLGKQKYGDIKKLGLSRIVRQKTLKTGEKFALGWKHNLCMLSSPEQIIDGELLNRLIAFAKKVVEAINIRFCSVDLIEKTEGVFEVIETNSIVSTGIFASTSEENYKTIKNIFAEALDKCFE